MEEPTILVADDKEKWHNVVAANLKYWGLGVPLSTFTLQEAKEIYTLEKPYITITDINFDTQNPKNLDGLILIEEITHDVREKILIAMSSTEKNIKERSLNAGAHYFIQKKFFKQQFNEIARSLISRIHLYTQY
jgi:CheY-like chemotaxis protein